MTFQYIKLIIATFFIGLISLIPIIFGTICLMGGIASYNTPTYGDIIFGLIVLAITFLTLVYIGHRLYKWSISKGTKSITTAIIIGIISIVPLFFYSPLFFT